jgi:hypothetical protein
LTLLWMPFLQLPVEPLKNEESTSLLTRLLIVDSSRVLLVGKKGRWFQEATTK